MSIELEEYRKKVWNGSTCNAVNRDELDILAGTEEVKNKCETLLKSQNIDYRVILPMVEPRRSDNCENMYDYGIVCKYIKNRNENLQENFSNTMQTSCGRVMLFIIVVIGLYLLWKK
jgi:hypothetical protein